MAADQKLTIPENSIQWRAFQLPKEGHSTEEYEDACDGNVALGRFAVADGASESVFARLWARLLVKHFVGQRCVEVDDWHKRLPEVQRQWQEELASRQLPWHAEQKFLDGSFATFLGLEIFSDDSGLLWQAVAVGDSCLFHTRGDRLLCAWPLEKSDQFNDSPRLIGSRTPRDEVNYNRALWKLPQSGAEQQLRLIPGDRLWLMTDALAQWFLMEYESGRCPWQQIDAELAIQFYELPSSEHRCKAACGSCAPATQTGADEPVAPETGMSELSTTQTNTPIMAEAETSTPKPSATQPNIPEAAAKQSNIPEPAATGCGAAEVAEYPQPKRPDDRFDLDSGAPEAAEDQQRFERWIGQLRRSGRLRNDDVTLVEVRIV